MFASKWRLPRVRVITYILVTIALLLISLVWHFLLTREWLSYLFSPEFPGTLGAGVILAVALEYRYRHIVTPKARSESNHQNGEEIK